MPDMMNSRVPLPHNSMERPPGWSFPSPEEKGRAMAMLTQVGATYGEDGEVNNMDAVVERLAQLMARGQQPTPPGPTALPMSGPSGPPAPMGAPYGDNYRMPPR